MYHQMEDLIPTTEIQFDPISAIINCKEPEEIKRIRIDAMMERALWPLLPQMMLHNFSFSNEDAKNYGVFAPQSILGPRRRIKPEEIKPGMGNVGYTKISSGRVITYIFNGLVTKVETVDNQIQIYSNDEVVRHDAEKQWFVQHVWEYSAVIYAGTGDDDVYVMEHGDAEEGDLILEINMNPTRPSSEIKEYKKNSAGLYQAYGGMHAVYFLSPKLELPRLSSDPIPPMPGSVPEPAPATPDDDAKPSESGPSIPPMPGGVEEEWLKPKSTDWWIS
jgi:hypothetical protein